VIFIKNIFSPLLEGSCFWDIMLNFITSFLASQGFQLSEWTKWCCVRGKWHPSKRSLTKISVLRTNMKIISNGVFNDLYWHKLNWGSFFLFWRYIYMPLGLQPVINTHLIINSHIFKVNELHHITYYFLPLLHTHFLSGSLEQAGAMYCAGNNTESYRKLMPDLTEFTV